MIEKVFYSENPDKDTKDRQRCLDGVAAFFDNAKKEAEKRRGEFFIPSKDEKVMEEYRAKLVEMLGFPLREKREIKSVEQVFVTRDGNVDIYRMHFNFANGLDMYGLYLKQVEDSKNKPFVFGLHGGWGTPELVSGIHYNSSNYNHLVRRITERGASVFAPQLLLWNVPNYGNAYERLEIDARMRELGGSVTALEIYMMQGALDWFIDSKEANADKLGVAGMSYGGMYALHLAAVDTRFKACFSCSWVCDVYEWLKIDWSYQNTQNTIAAAETAALIAPRTLVVGMGNNDPAWKLGTVRECAKISSYFKKMDCENKFRYIEYEGVHEVDKGDEWLDVLFEGIEVK